MPPATVVLRSEAELEPYWACAGGSGIDFEKQALVLVPRTLSPAQIGSVIYDDGKVVTLASKQRSPCPDDPRPMPTPSLLAFLLPAGETREVRDGPACTVPPICR